MSQFKKNDIVIANDYMIKIKEIERCRYKKDCNKIGKPLGRICNGYSIRDVTSGYKWCDTGRFRCATLREQFLYYTHGPRALIEDKENVEERKTASADKNSRSC